MRRLSGALLGIGLAVTSLAAWAGAASAQAPTQQGWWTATNPGSMQGLPGPPAPPDVPADGLLVEGGTSSTPGAQNSAPTAYAALAYPLAPGSTVGKLTLPVAPASASTPNATLQLCPLKSSGFFPQQGGPIAEGPAFDCSRNVAAEPSADGTTYAFDAATLVVDDVLAVAVLPTSPTDRVVLSAPGAAALVVQPPVGSTPSGDDLSPGSGPPATGSSGVGSGTAVAPTPATALGPEIAPTPAPAPEIAPTPPPVVAQEQPQTAVTQLAAAESSPARVAALIAAAFVGWALWAAAGRAAVRRCIPR